MSNTQRANKLDYKEIDHKAIDHGQSGPDLDAALEALQAVVMTQKAQIDTLLASLEGLLAALNNAPLPGGQSALATQAELPCADAALLGDPLDPQFASLHQLMERLKAG